MIGVVAIGNDLLRLASEFLLAALQRRIQLAVVDGIGGGFHVHYQTMRGVRYQLHVVAGHRSAFAVPHYVGFWIGAGGTRHVRFAVMRFFALQSLHFMQRCFQTAGALSRGTPARCGLALRQLLLVLRLRVQNAHLLAGRRQMHRNLLVATEGVAARIGFDLSPVQSYPF